MDDRELAQKRADLKALTRRIAELQDDAADLARDINEEEERRKDTPGTVHPFRPRPAGPNPTDQGSQ